MYHEANESERTDLVRKVNEVDLSRMIRELEAEKESVSRAILALETMELEQRRIAKRSSEEDRPTSPPEAVKRRKG